jgi:acyl-coenzyme A thioesterase PaaI-like protein
MDTVSTPRPDAAHRSFLSALGLRIRTEEDITHGEARLGPGVWARDSHRPRLGALATMADLVAGLRPGGALTPTVDLDIQLLATPPSTGEIQLRCRPLKEGRRLFVGEVLIDHAGAPLARAILTFLNQPYTGPLLRTGYSRTAATPPVPIDDWLHPEFVDAHTVAVAKNPAITNPNGTIQGGAQAIVCEIASEWALAPHGEFIVGDIDIRYFGPLAAGPLVATAEVSAVYDDRAFVTVRLTDSSDGRPVAFAHTVGRPTR